ncbi:triosephosphate isomerase [Candidatus Woesebacteria bacterium]|nr:triosephosphate isomerase [Candidatus Woesebacteria bacterium]
MKTVIANFKSNKTLKEYEEWLQNYEQYLPQLHPSLRVVLAPSFPALPLFSSWLTHCNSAQTFLGVQDLSSFPAGAYTGAVCAQNLQDLGVTYAILGHSERRRYFHETNQDVTNKVAECIANQITPIVCVTADQVEQQAAAIDDGDKTKILVAYEPIEHIGTGISDSESNILATKERVAHAFGNVSYIYGGSVNPSTESSILQEDTIDGFLVGTASLTATTFTSLLSALIH